MANDDPRDPMQIGDYNKNIQIGNNNTIGITDIELAEQLGVGKVAVRNFLRLLDQQNVSIEEWDHTLRKLAERHKELERRAALLESDDPEVTSLQNQARQAIADIRYEIAEDFLEKAVKLDNAAAEKIKAIFLKRKRSAAENKALKAESLLTRFAFVEAIKAYEQAVILAQEGEDEEKITLYKNMLGCVYLDKGEYQKAVSYFEQALASDLKTYGEDHPNVARDRNNLGSVWCSLGEYRKAASYLEQALASNLKIYGEGHPSVAAGRNNLGLAWDSLGEYQKAVSYHEQALASDLKNYGEDHPSVARDRNNLGSAWYSLGEYQKAVGYHEQALASDLKTYGEDHPSVTRDRNNLGLTWNSLGEYLKAISYFEQALASDLKMFGEDHPSVARDRNNLGSAWNSLGEYRKAISYYEQSLVFLSKSLGPNHPYSIQVKSSLRIANQKQKKVAKKIYVNISCEHN